MKITTTTVATPTEATTRTSTVARAYSGNSSSSAASVATSSQVDLSSASQQLLALQDNSGDIDTDRVQAIRDAITSGQYTVDPSRITDGLISSIQDLLK